MRLGTAEIFYDKFGYEPEITGFAPGRVNLIGEHTDYNGGRVFPCALDLGIEGSACRRSDRKLRFYSADFNGAGVVELSLDSGLGGGWTDYPLSVFKAFSAMGYRADQGADFVFKGSLPHGSGLSSSAALEVLTGLLISRLCGFSVTAQELAVFGQFAENRFIGVNCGIMDQFASAVGKKGCAVLLDSLTLGYSYARVADDDTALVIVNSGVKHLLASSAYNDRRRECETALAQINGVFKAPSLCSLSTEEFERYSYAVTDPVCRRRAKHAVYENSRVAAAAKALENGDLERFGELMKESHLSLKNDYEVSCAELDFLASLAWELPGVYGARMTGGGFGGCTVNLMKKESLGSFAETVKKEYKTRFGREAEIYAANIGDGARILPKE